MKDKDKTKEQLIAELVKLRQKITELEEMKNKSKIAEKSLLENENRFNELFNHISSGVAVYEAKDNGRDFIIKDFNRAAEKIDKIKKEEIVGKSVLKVFPGVKDLGLFKVFQEVYKTGKPQHYPISLYKDQRITGWRENYVYKIPLGEIVAVYDDIIERIQAEKELINSEEYLKILFDYAPDAYYISDIKGKFIDGNKAAERLIGYKKEELIGKSFLKLKLLSLADIPKAAKLLVKNLRGQPTGSDEFVLNRKDNSKVTVEISTYPVKIKGKTLALGIARDITERIQTEEKEKEYYNNLQTLSKTAMTFVDFPVDKNIYNFIGEQLREFIGKDSYIIINTFDEKTSISTVRAVLGLGKFIDNITKLMGRNPVGMTFDVEDTSQHYADGKIHLYEEGLYGLVLKTIPEILCKSMEKLLNIKKLYIVDLAKQGQFFGSIIIFLRENSVELKNKQIIETFIKQASITIQRRQAEERLIKTMDAAIDTMSKIIEVKDPYTHGHQRRVCQLSVSLARELELTEDKVEGIRIASLIHDIGKIGLPTEILSKPTKLSDMEFDLIKGHSQIGYNILKSIDFPWPIAQITLQHHEKIDGSGYPGGLKGDGILLEAKIICVADVVEAMSSHRPYRAALGTEKALEEISQNRGILYDPEVVDTCLKLFREKGFKFE